VNKHKGNVLLAFILMSCVGTIPGVKTLLDFVSNQNPKAKSAAPESFVEHRIVRLLNSGFFAKLYQ
jgi:hypothetical protein